MGFDCSICYGKLEEPGPQLDQLTFGQIFEPAGSWIREARRIVGQAEGIRGEIERLGRDCDQILATPCGHLFHSGCLREWYFVNRGSHSRSVKCPYCNQLAPLQNCMSVFPAYGVEVAGSMSNEGLEIMNNMGAVDALQEREKAAAYAKNMSQAVLFLVITGILFVGGSLGFCKYAEERRALEAQIRQEEERATFFRKLWALAGTFATAILPILYRKYRRIL